MRIYRNKCDSWDNLSLGMQFRTCENFGDFADSKSSLNPQNFHKYKSHTANTSIVLNANDSNESSLRGSVSEAKTTKQSTLCRHTERSEVSKTRESNKNNESMIEKRINESNSPLQHCDSGNLDSRDLDSSLRTSCFAQNDEFGNDESSANSHKSTTKDTL